MIWVFAIHTPETPFVYVSIIPNELRHEAQSDMESVKAEMPDATVELFPLATEIAL